MSRVPIAYDTTEGHTRKIARDAGKVTNTSKKHEHTDMLWRSLSIAAIAQRSPHAATRNFDVLQFEMVDLLAAACDNLANDRYSEGIVD